MQRLFWAKGRDARSHCGRFPVVHVSRGRAKTGRAYLHGTATNRHRLDSRDSMGAAGPFKRQFIAGEPANRHEHFDRKGYC